MNKPSIAQVRKAVREVCDMAKGAPLTEAMLLRFVRELLGTGVDLQMLRDAIEWNLSEAYLRYEDDAESEQKNWFITAAGQAKERIK